MKVSKERSCYITRLVAAVMVVMLVFPALSSAQAGKTSFAGEWTMNAEKSTQPQGGPGGGSPMRMGGGNIVVTQDANTMTVDRTRTGQDGQPVKTTMKYTLDGKVSTNTSQRGESKSVATWSPDGKSLTIETTRTMEMNGETRSMKSTEVWKLNDAKTLSVESTRESPGGEVKSTIIYDKK